MTSLDEALRALEKRLRDDANGGAGYSTTAYEDGRIAEKLKCADELAALLTTRQEVAPVYQMMAVVGDEHDDPNLWMDCSHDDYERLRYRPDVRSRIVYTTTGQTSKEVAPVAMPLTDDEHEWLMYAVDHMLDDSEPEDKTCARVLQGLLDRCVVTSPGQTSDARDGDAARYRWLRTVGVQINSWKVDHKSIYQEDALDEAIDAAMRQEAE